MSAQCFFVHGDYVVKSREFLAGLLQRAKREERSVIRLAGKNLGLDELTQATQEASLFGGEKVVVVEGLFSRQKSKALSEILDWVGKYDWGTPVYFWEGKKIGKILQRKLPKGTVVKEFKMPAAIFHLVERLDPESLKPAVSLFDEMVAGGESAEFLMAMVARQMRLLLLVQGGEQLAGPPWMVGKLKKQAVKFAEAGLVRAYERLYKIDREIKTGRSIMDLRWRLRQWMVELRNYGT